MHGDRYRMHSIGNVHLRAKFRIDKIVKNTTIGTPKRHHSTKNNKTRNEKQNRTGKNTILQAKHYRTRTRVKSIAPEGRYRTVGHLVMVDELRSQAGNQVIDLP